MKVTKQQAPSSFQPVTVTIVLETALELEVFKEMSGTDHSVPTMIYEDDAAKRNTLGTLMSQIYRAI